MINDEEKKNVSVVLAAFEIDSIIVACVDVNLEALERNSRKSLWKLMKSLRLTNNFYWLFILLSVFVLVKAETSHQVVVALPS